MPYRRASPAAKGEIAANASKGRVVSPPCLGGADAGGFADHAEHRRHAGDGRAKRRSDQHDAYQEKSLAAGCPDNFSYRHGRALLKMIAEYRQPFQLGLERGVIDRKGSAHSVTVRTALPLKLRSRSASRAWAMSVHGKVKATRVSSRPAATRVSSEAISAPMPRPDV